MAGRIAAALELTTERRQDLTALSRTHSTPQKLAERARIILLAADSVSVSETARRLCVWRKTASMWRKRWREVQSAASTAERLSDAPRRGAPGKFTPEQGLRDHRLGPQGQRSTHQPMEPERGGPASGQARHCRQHFARLGGTLF